MVLSADVFATFVNTHEVQILILIYKLILTYESTCLKIRKTSVVTTRSVVYGFKILCVAQY